MMKQVLEGVKMLDLTISAAGPWVGTELAQHGATVVRVETHRYPNPIKIAAPFKDNIPGMDRSAFGTCYDAQKYSISVDMNYPKGREIITRLVEWADIVAESMTPGTVAKFGFDYEGCRRIKPDIIYLSSSQVGQEGPIAKFAGWGIMGCSHVGLTEILGWPDRPPLPPANTHSDNIAPFFGIGAIVLALL